MQLTEDLYKILQVDPEADIEVIEAAYRRLARKYHPDINHAADASDRMKELNAAYHVLRDPTHRSVYDERRPRQARPSAATRALACKRHGDRTATSDCDACGAGLCATCSGRFEPPTCPACVLRWARRRELSSIASLLAFAMVVVALVGLAAWAAGRAPELLSLPIGDLELGLPAAAAMICSIVVAALVGRALWDLRQLRAVVAEALAVV